jgi:ketosteroid isomerase-like protein
MSTNGGGSIMDGLDRGNNRSHVVVSADPDNQAKEGIRKFNETVTAAVRNQDAAAKASLWTEDTRVLPPGREMITGRAAVQAFWQSGFDHGVYDLVLESGEIKSLGDGVAYEIGRSITRVRTPDGSSIDVPGKSLCIYRREGDGIWRADVDIFNAVD